MFNCLNYYITKTLTQQKYVMLYYVEKWPRDIEKSAANIGRLNGVKFKYFY